MDIETDTDRTPQRALIDSMPPLRPPEMNEVPEVSVLESRDASVSLLITRFNEDNIQIERFSEPSVTDSETETEEGELPDEDDLVALEHKQIENYRRGERKNDFTQRNGVICFRSRSGTVYTRCSRSLTSRKNLVVSLLSARWGLINIHNDLKDFYNFVKFGSGQARRDWGTGLSLANPNSLSLLVNDPALIECAASYFQLVTGGKSGEGTCRDKFNGLVMAIMMRAGWRLGVQNEIEPSTIAGGHVSYSFNENDEIEFPPAVGNFTDALFRSADLNRRAVFEWKRPGTLRDIYSESAFIQMFTAAIGHKADLGFIVDGMRFGIYWFTTPEDKTNHIIVHKYLDSSNFAEFNVEGLIALAAHVAFFIADPLIGNVYQSTRVIAAETSESAGKREGDSADQNKDWKRQDGNSKSSGKGGSKCESNAKEDVYEQVIIEGTSGQDLVCFRLRDDVNETIRSKVIAEIERDE